MARNMMANLKAIAADTYTSDIKMIDISELHDSPDNFFEIERVEEFAETILGQGGVKDNLVVRPLETGGYEIISGHRRKAAVQFLIDRGDIISRFLPCLVQHYSDDSDRKLDLIFMNVSTRKLSDAELYRSFEIVSDILSKKKEAGEKFGKIRETLAGYLGVSSSQVGKLQNIEKYAVPEVKNAIDKGSLSIATANQIARLDEQQQAKLVNTPDLSSVKHKDVKAQVDTCVKSAKSNTKEKVDTCVTIPDNGNRNKKVDTCVTFLKEHYQDLLEKITERHNEDSGDNYTSADMLELIIVQYTLQNYEDLLPSSKE